MKFNTNPWLYVITIHNKRAYNIRSNRIKENIDQKFSRPINKQYRSSPRSRRPVDHDSKPRIKLYTRTHAIHRYTGTHSCSARKTQCHNERQAALLLAPNADVCGISQVALYIPRALSLARREVKFKHVGFPPATRFKCVYLYRDHRSIHGVDVLRGAGSLILFSPSHHIPVFLSQIEIIVSAEEVPPRMEYWIACSAIMHYSRGWLKIAERAALKKATMCVCIISTNDASFFSAICKVRGSDNCGIGSIDPYRSEEWFEL